MSDLRVSSFSNERRALLDEFFAVGERIDAVASALEPDAADLARYAQLRRTYREMIPRITLSRCPFTRAEYVHSIDAFGLDGTWWDHRSPNRPLEMMRGNVVAFTGAVRLNAPIEQMPFLCRPGPGVPFVVPRLLARAGVRAVLYSLPIGVHTGYVITYFADPAPDDLEGFNDWGTDFYQFESDTDRAGWDQASLSAADHDFALEPYVKSGQLLWIRSGDESMALHEGVSGCPYLGLDGIRVPQLVQDGERWHDEYTLNEVGQVQPDAAPTLVACSHCGQARRSGARFCRSCGKA